MPAFNKLCIFFIVPVVVCQAITMLIMYTNFQHLHEVVDNKQQALTAEFAKNRQLRSDVRDANLALMDVVRELNFTRYNVEETRKQLITAQLKFSDYKIQQKKMWLTVGGDLTKFLVIVVPTVPRKDDYLTRTVERLVQQLPADPKDPFYNRVLVVVCNSRPGLHTAFNAVRNQYATHPKAMYLRFIEQSIPDPENARDVGNPNKPGWMVRQQTRDVVGLLRQVVSLGAHYMVMEDDFLLCPHGIKALHYFIEKANAYRADWIALRCSYGLNGYIFKNDDLPTITSYLEEHLSRRPPDHLVPEFVGAETPQSKAYVGSRHVVAFRHNLFQHIGAVSTLRSELSPTYPGCFELLVFPVIFEVESFKPEVCPKDDIWPCDTRSPDVPEELINFSFRQT